MMQMKNKYVEENLKNTRRFEAVPSGGDGSSISVLAGVRAGSPGSRRWLRFSSQAGVSLFVNEPAVTADDRAEFQVIW